MKPVRKPRTMAGPKTGTVRDALTVLTTAIANGSVDGVVLAIQDHEGCSYSLHGEIRATDLAYVGTMLQKWAMEATR